MVWLAVLKKSLDVDRRHPLAWRRAFRVSIAIALPLSLALLRGDFLPAVYGGVAGLYSMFVDNGGRSVERILAILYMTVGMLICGMCGVIAHWVPGAQLAMLLAFSLTTGWFQGAGSSVELMSKYWLIAYLFGDSNPALPPVTGSYLLLGGLSGTLAVVIDRFCFRQTEVQTGPMLMEAIRHLLRRRHLNTSFSIYFSLQILIGYIVANYFDLTRAYWVPLTICIITCYDADTSMVKVSQRILGTLFGALLGWILLRQIEHVGVLIPIAVVLGAMCALLLNRNYGLAVIPITALVMVLLEFGSHQSSGTLAVVHMENTLIGVLICFISAGIYQWLQVWKPSLRP